MAGEAATAAVAAASAFVATQVDELFVLSQLFARSKVAGAKTTPGDVALGYGLGTVCVLLASACGAAG